MRGTLLGIAGVGLIGGSIALRARAAGATVIGFDRDPQAVRAALAAGALDASAPSLAALAERCAIVAIALPPDTTAAVLAGEPALAAPELVFDVASVKAPIVAAAGALAPFVASHPLAGRERGGFGAAEPALFEGRTWAIVPARDPAAQARLSDLVTALGGRPFVIGADEHDHLVAISSHLPQMLSVVLGAALAGTADADPRVYDLCGPGMRSMLRLAASDVRMWAPIAQANAAALADAMNALAAGLRATAAGIRNGESAPLLSAFGDAHRAVDELQRIAAATPTSPVAHP